MFSRDKIMHHSASPSRISTSTRKVRRTTLTAEEEQRKRDFEEEREGLMAYGGALRMRAPGHVLVELRNVGFIELNGKPDSEGMVEKLGSWFEQAWGCQRVEEVGIKEGPKNGIVLEHLE